MIMEVQYIRCSDYSTHAAKLQNESSDKSQAEGLSCMPCPAIDLLRGGDAELRTQAVTKSGWCRSSIGAAGDRIFATTLSTT